MSDRILITGGAGFIGSHVADELLDAGYRVRILDILSPQVHGADGGAGDGAPRAAWPSYLTRDAELMAGDVCDPDDIRRALDGVDGVIHLAAAVGVGQSMYEIGHYVGVNSLGTARLYEAMRDSGVRRLVVASSMSIYGEGLYRAAGDGRPVQAARRSREQLERGDWDPRDEAGRPLLPVPTAEDKAPDLASVYALTKFDQECLTLMFGAAYRIPSVALRFFNVYGPRQALSNPYTGVLAIFGSRLLNGKPPLLFEDGDQQRDFVSVYDVARACRLAYESDTAGEAFNIGSGTAISIREVAERLARALGRDDIGFEVTGRYRFGDIRHCFADIARAKDRLGYEPLVSFDDGIAQLVEWLRSGDVVAIDRVARMASELDRYGLAWQGTAGERA